MSKRTPILFATDKTLVVCDVQIVLVFNAWEYGEISVIWTDEQEAVEMEEQLKQQNEEQLDLRMLDIMEDER